MFRYFPAAQDHGGEFEPVYRADTPSEPADESYEIRKDDVLILEAGKSHYGIEPCTVGTRTIFIHALALETDDIRCETHVCLNNQTGAKGNPAIRQCFEQVAYAWR